MCNSQGRHDVDGGTLGERVPDYDKERLQATSPLEPPLGLQDVSPDLSKRVNARNLDNALVRGVAWTAAVKWLTQLVTWGMTVVVARLLAPSDYGLVGMAAIYINLFTLFSEFGIGAAVVTMQDLTADQVSQLNTLSLLLGILGSIISAAAAIPLGKFFHAPNLPLVVIVLSCGFIFSGIRTVPYSLLQKELRFKLLAAIEGLQGLVQALFTLTLALLGFGIGPSVLGILSFSVTPTVLVLIWRRQSYSVSQIFIHSKSYKLQPSYCDRTIVLGELQYSTSSLLASFWSSSVRGIHACVDAGPYSPRETDHPR